MLILYSYTYDKTTGGILLNFSPTNYSKEPRPVYASELDVLGFNKYWKYDEQVDLPYMWAEANNYYYRGKLVASLSGGNIFNAPVIQLAFQCEEYKETPKSKKTIAKVICNIPDNRPSFTDKNGNIFNIVEPELNGKKLLPINIKLMIKKNKEILSIIEQTTVKKILAIYTKYKNKLDCFHVAFSGGKDSCVLLDLVKKALPKDSFVVVFGDTGMEFPDTYNIIEKTKQQCIEEEISFFIAKSHLIPEQTWKLFGPPSRVLRWCCSVHKSAPQTFKLREIMGKDDYTGLAFVGVRAHESVARSEYDYLNKGKKIKGQYSHNSILEWTSAEIWLYIYANTIAINEAYKKGNTRAGCIFCPMSVNKSDYIKYSIYKSEMELYLDLVRESNGRNYGNDTYLSEGGWVSRRSGRDLIGNAVTYSDTVKNGVLIITVINPKTDWHEWIKTLDNYSSIPYKIKTRDNGYSIQLSEEYCKENPIIVKFFKQVFRKSAYCVNCRVCEANCTWNCIKFNNRLRITECKHCLKCHEIEDGCLAYNSLKIPKEEKTMSINSYDTTLPETSWFVRFFKEKDDYWKEHNLGPNQVKSFKSMLKHAGLIDKQNFTPLAELIANIGCESDISWGIILVNFAAESPQFQWYINNMELYHVYSREIIISMLLEVNKSTNVVKNVYRAYSKLIELPLGTVLHWGSVTEEGDLIRTKCSVSNPLVILYGLFKFAEKCNDYKEFTLATLLNDSIDRNGISPTRIFGLDRDDMIPILLGLSAKYHEFINASFTHDLEKIILAGDKSSQDVLDLFKGDVTDG